VWKVIVAPDHNDTHTHTHTLGRTPLNEGSARCRDLYLSTHNTYKRQTSMPPEGFETAIPANERPQTQTLDRASTEFGTFTVRKYIFISMSAIRN